MMMNCQQAFEPFFTVLANVHAARVNEGDYRDSFLVAVLPGNAVTNSAGAPTQLVPAESFSVLIKRASWRSVTPPELGNTIECSEYGALIVKAVDPLPDCFRCTCARNMRARR